jgi:hypothetical protein
VPDLFSGAAVAKTQRQRSLLNVLHGRVPQARDQHGRCASFDGGARQPVPIRRQPEQEHNRLIGELASAARTFRVGGS